MTQSDKPSSPTSTDTKIDTILAEYFTWKGEAITEINQTANYKRMKTALKTLLTSEKNKAVVEAKEARIRQNQSFCGCPFCTHHSEPYERHVKEAQLNSLQGE